MNHFTILSLVSICLGEGALAAERTVSFDSRCRAFLDAVWTNYQATVAKPSAHMAFWRAEALFELGNIE